jgi:hypothetical protein
VAGQRHSWLDGRVDVLLAALDEYRMDNLQSIGI